LIFKKATAKKKPNFEELGKKEGKRAIRKTPYRASGGHRQTTKGFSLQKGKKRGRTGRVRGRGASVS